MNEDIMNDDEFVEKFLKHVRSKTISVPYENSCDHTPLPDTYKNYCECRQLHMESFVMYMYSKGYVVLDIDYPARGDYENSGRLILQNISFDPNNPDEDGQLLTQESLDFFEEKLITRYFSYYKFIRFFDDKVEIEIG